MSEMLYEEDTYRILGACFEVYKEKGCGFTEPVYQECLEIELAHQAIPFVAQQKVVLTYRGQQLEQTYKPDFICFDRIIVELKATSALIDEHRAQLLNYLHASRLRVGLLINFGHHPKLEQERYVV
jgi:GxxExxY protein